MSGLDPDVEKAVRGWVQYAEDDLKFANHGLTAEQGSANRIIAFHAQQAVEKYLKGYLVLRGVDFPYTHDIDRLLSLCASAGADISRIGDAIELTPYAAMARYPGRSESVTAGDAQGAVEIAATVRDEVRQWLSDACLTDIP